MREKWFKGRPSHSLLTTADPPHDAGDLHDEYESEGIAWTPIPYFNNKIVCDMIEGAKPPGLFRVLDDTCKTMHSRGESTLDRGFLDNLGKSFSGHQHFRKVGSGR